MENNNGNFSMPTWVIFAVAWVLAGYFFIIFHVNEGFPPTHPVTTTNWIFLAGSIILFIFPFASRIKIGSSFEFERKIQNVKESVDDFKTETRQSLSLISSTITSISNISNINVFVPNNAEYQAARQGIQEVTLDNIEAEAENVRQELLLDDDDIIMPLARTRIRIEQLLRQILRKNRDFSAFQDREIKYLSARRLFERFIDAYPNYQPMGQTFNYVIKICNAAAHGLRIPKEEADNALGFGSEIIAVLSDIAGE